MRDFGGFKRSKSVGTFGPSSKSHSQPLSVAWDRGLADGCSQHGSGVRVGRHFPWYHLMPGR